RRRLDHRGRGGADGLRDARRAGLRPLVLLPGRVPPPGPVINAARLLCSRSGQKKQIWPGPHSRVRAGRVITSTEFFSDHEPSVDLEVLAVDDEPAAEAQVADQVGVDGRLVDAARLRIALADRHVDGAADL